MPLPKSTIQPIYAGRVELVDASEMASELEYVANNVLCNTILQMSSISSHAYTIFSELFNEILGLVQRTNQLNQRLVKLRENYAKLNDSSMDNKIYFDGHIQPFVSDKPADSLMLTRTKHPLPPYLQLCFDSAAPTPALAQMDHLRSDGKTTMKLYSDPDFFFDQWCQKMLGDRESNRRGGKKKRNKPKPNKQQSLAPASTSNTPAPPPSFTTLPRPNQQKPPIQQQQQTNLDYSYDQRHQLPPQGHPRHHNNFHPPPPQPPSSLVNGGNVCVPPPPPGFDQQLFGDASSLAELEEALQFTPATPPEGDAFFAPAPNTLTNNQQQLPPAPPPCPPPPLFHDHQQQLPPAPIQHEASHIPPPPPPVVNGVKPIVADDESHDFLPPPPPMSSASLPPAPPPPPINTATNQSAAPSSNGLPPPPSPPAPPAPPSSVNDQSLADQIKSVKLGGDNRPPPATTEAAPNGGGESRGDLMSAIRAGNFKLKKVDMAPKLAALAGKLPAPMSSGAVNGSGGQPRDVQAIYDAVFNRRLCMQKSSSDEDGDRSDSDTSADWN